MITTAISNALVEKVEQTSAFANLENKRETLVDQLQFNLNQDVVNTERKEVPEIHDQVENQNLRLLRKLANTLI